MKVGYVQFKPAFGQKENNLKRILGFLEEAAEREADLVILPELCTTGYAFRSKAEARSLSENVPGGETTELVGSFAEKHNISVVAGLSEMDNGKLFNSAILTGPKGLISVYRKPHLFDKEKLWFSSGNGPISVWETPKAKVGVMICFDWIFPEVTRILALKGAQIVCHPSNLVLPYCQQSLLGAAIQNKVFIVTANRVGRERGLRFTGMNQILSPDMKILARSPKSREEIRIVEIDPKDADSKNITAQNNLWNDRRLDLYDSVLSKTA
jgi:predicted amidohydrolase